MSAVGLTWELATWAPKLGRLTRAWSAETGRAFSLAPEDVRDDIVFRSLDVLPVPVVQVPMEEAAPTVDLGWVGESLARLEVAGRVRRVDCVDRRMWMRVTEIGQIRGTDA